MNKINREELLKLFDSLTQNYIIEEILHREHSCDFWIIESIYSILYPNAYQEAQQEEE